VDAYLYYFNNLGIKTDVIDLREFKDSDEIKDKLKDYDVVWAAGGNTFCLRYEMRRSGFEDAIKELLANGLVYGGDSAGALVAGYQIGGLGIETVDNPEFAEIVIEEGLKLVPFVVIPHADNPEFIDTTNLVRSKVKSDMVIELNDLQAVIFENANHRLVSAD
jgi:dipeptidase E